VDMESVLTWGETIDLTVELSLLAGVLNEVDNTANVVLLLWVLEDALGPDRVLRVGRVVSFLLWLLLIAVLGVGIEIITAAGVWVLVVRVVIVMVGERLAEGAVRLLVRGAIAILGVGLTIRVNGLVVGVQVDVGLTVVVLVAI